MNPPQPPQGGNGGSHHLSAGEGPSTVYTFEMTDLQMKTKTYGDPVANSQDVASSSNPLPPNNLHIERLVSNLVIHPPKGELHCATHNTSICVA